jgi:hypothetical protein
MPATRLNSIVWRASLIEMARLAPGVAARPLPARLAILSGAGKLRVEIVRQYSL